MAWKPDYVTSDELKAYLEIDSSDDDAFVALWVTTASRNVDGFCGRQFGKSDTTVVREFNQPIWDRAACAWVHVVDDIYADDDLVVLDADGGELDVTLEPLNAAADGVPFERILTESPGRISVSTSKWGWASVPSSIKVGMLLMGARLAARRGSPFGVAGSPSDGSEIRLLARLDPDMLTVLRGGGFKRRWWAA